MAVHTFCSQDSGHRISCGAWARTGLVVVAAVLGSGKVQAEPNLAPQNTDSRQAPEPAPAAGESGDGFVPMTRLAPRARIALRPNERLPDREGEKTFAQSGTRSVTPDWYAGPPPIPMYIGAYHPLYFEDPNLERNGIACHCLLQPLVSGGHFFGSIAFLPVKIPYSPPCSYVFPPDECPPGTRFSHCRNFIGQKPDLR